jgi:hypothetical protein
MRRFGLRNSTIQVYGENNVVSDAPACASISVEARTPAVEMPEPFPAQP